MAGVLDVFRPPDISAVGCGILARFRRSFVLRKYDYRQSRVQECEEMRKLDVI